MGEIKWLIPGMASLCRYEKAGQPAMDCTMELCRISVGGQLMPKMAAAVTWGLLGLVSFLFHLLQWPACDP